MPGTADPHDEYEGLSVSDITVSVTDPDRSRAVLTSSGSPITAVTVLEESTSEYGVALSHQPASGDTLTVTLTVSGSGTQVTVAPIPVDIQQFKLGHGADGDGDGRGGHESYR